jgi:hypothetical protein|tara:strand:- start:4371 stop:4619 length:249 start_codon:yes stop_codon:yes gene_type:complete
MSDIYLKQGMTRQLMHLLNACGIKFEYMLEEQNNTLFDIVKFKTLDGLKLEFINILDNRGSEAYFAVDSNHKREEIEDEKNN